MLATTRSSVTATQVTSAGDLITMGNKPTLIRTPITKAVTIVSDDSQISIETHSRVGLAVSSETTLASTHIVGLHPYGDASTNAFTLSEWDTGSFRPGSVLSGATSALTSAYYGLRERTYLVPSPLRPNFLGEYGQGIRGYIPPYVRDVPDRFGLSLPRPSIMEEPIDLPPAAMAAD